MYVSFAPFSCFRFVFSNANVVVGNLPAQLGGGDRIWQRGRVVEEEVPMVCETVGQDSAIQGGLSRKLVVIWFGRRHKYKLD